MSVSLFPFSRNRGLQLEGLVGSQANSKVTLHQLEKLSRRFIKMYSLPLEEFPYTAALNARKSLHFILVQRYRLKVVSDTNLDELLKVSMLRGSAGKRAVVCVCVRSMCAVHSGRIHW